LQKVKGKILATNTSHASQNCFTSTLCVNHDDCTYRLSISVMDRRRVSANSDFPAITADQTAGQFGLTIFEHETDVFPRRVIDDGEDQPQRPG
jgi:hypothetical protein